MISEEYKRQLGGVWEEITTKELTRLRKYEEWAKRAHPLLVDWLESTTPAAFDNEQVTDTEQLLNDWPGGE